MIGNRSQQPNRKIVRAQTREQDGEVRRGSRSDTDANAVNQNAANVLRLDIIAQRHPLSEQAARFQVLSPRRAARQPRCFL
ncbi:MAG: hypothetical protein HY741_09720 [Chloroflexi bacterium]|nr:hypothetical protein [Chloroflexota bacterium]